MFSRHRTRLSSTPCSGGLRSSSRKSVREGFGLTVTEAMWKGAAVIGGRAGGIPHQIENGVNGFLVETVAQAAGRIIQLVRDPELRRRLGARARETVRARFLMTGLMEDWLDLIASFEVAFGSKAVPAHEGSPAHPAADAAGSLQRQTHAVIPFGTDARAPEGCLRCTDRAARSARAPGLKAIGISRDCCLT